MRHFITAGGRTGALDRAQHLLLLCPLLLTASATEHHPGATAAGYSEKQLSRNVFLVGVGAGSGAKERRATDLCLLRCAEVALAHGFSHFVVVENRKDLTSPSAVPGNRVLRADDGDLTYLSAETAKPSSLNTIACFRRPPTSFTDVHDAKALREQLALRYHLPLKPLASAEPLGTYTPQFDLYSIFLLLPQTSADHITFLDPGSTRRSFLIGALTDWENPCATLDEFKQKAAKAAAILGGQAILIREGTGRTGDADGGAGNAGFRAELRLVPTAQLGILEEAADWPRKEMVIRAFDKNSLAPNVGLKVGDRIIALNGTEVLQQKRLVDCWLSWKVGEDVVVTFVRNGTEMTTQAKTIAN